MVMFYVADVHRCFISPICMRFGFPTNSSFLNIMKFTEIPENDLFFSWIRHFISMALGE